MNFFVVCSNYVSGIIYLTDKVKSPGFEELGLARKELSYPRSINNRSASKPDIFG